MQALFKSLACYVVMLRVHPSLYHLLVCPLNRLDRGNDGKKQLTPIRPIAVLSGEMDITEANIKLM